MSPLWPPSMLDCECGMRGLDTAGHWMWEHLVLRHAAPNAASLNQPSTGTLQRRQTLAEQSLIITPRRSHKPGVET